MERTLLLGQQQANERVTQLRKCKGKMKRWNSTPFEGNIIR